MTTETAQPPGEQPRNISETPDFQAGKLTINVLSTSPEGLQVKTRSNLPRRQGMPKVTALIPDKALGPIKRGMNREVATALENAGVTIPEPESEDPLLAKHRAKIAEEVMTSEQQDEYERRVSEAQVRTARVRRLHNLSSAEWQRYKIEFRKSQKTGIRNVELDGDTLIVDTVPVPFPFYRNINQLTENHEVLLLADVAATATVLKTRDGLFVVQYRSENNAFYGGTPGVSAGGYLEGGKQRGPEGAGTLPKISTNTVIGNGVKEAAEELGVKKTYGIVEPIDTQTIKEFAAEKAASETGEDPADIRRIRITGLATDNRRVHHEFLLYGELRHGASELLEEARRAKQAKSQEKIDLVDFEEAFFFIPATPEAITTLLTDIKCPLPDTHTDAFIAAGYTLLLETGDLEAARAWKDKMQIEVAKNYDEIDTIVRNYHSTHPEIAQQNQGIDINAYDPSFIPELQGLPSLDDELERTHLEEVIEKTVGSSYLFDVDGVLTDIEERRVTREEMFDELIRRLEVSPIGFNTGRSLEWVVANVLDPLKTHIQTNNKNPKMLANLFIAAESGGVWATIDKKGNVDKHIDEELNLPQDLADEARQLLMNKYAHAVSFLDPKTTMLSPEKNVGYDQHLFDEEKLQIKTDLEALVNAHGLSDRFKVDATTIAIDLRSVNSGKNVGARKFLEWLSQKKISVKTFYTFGDTESDIEMAEEMEKEGQNVQHEHFGNKLTPEQVGRHPGTIIAEPTRRFSDAVLQYLRESEI